MDCAESDPLNLILIFLLFSEAINRRRQGNPDQSVTAAENKITLPHISNNLWLAPSR